MSKLSSHSVRSILAVALTAAAAVVAPLSPAGAAPGDPETVAAQVEPSVARIDTVVDYQHAYGIGTGIVLSPGGEVLTNYHVVQGANSISAVVGGQRFPADLVGYDRQNDIAVLQLHGAAGLPPAPIGDSATLAPGQPVVALGNAGGSGAPLTHEVGTVSAFGRTVNAEDELTGSSDEINGLFEFAAPVRAGDSGGPVVNDAGQVVGLTTAASVNFRMGPGGKGFAIPINDAMAIAGQIRARNSSGSVHIGPPTMLGVGVRTAQRQNGGVIIQDVVSGGPADAAGLIPGDLLTAIDNTPLDSARTLTLTLDQHYPGDVIGLTWVDGAGQLHTGKATLAAGP
ncbi:MULTISPECIES: S1C family serine protease [unclassified Mycolicibacterium]|uniref:S1C family serine protease n=1 Tax=unclassified Mycolicibacterium TaxID=2636767 RepID=UPI0012DF4EB8|nr:MULTISPECIES: S1C family serine protease [unclassified Mycolicibacterium]MUL84261.1 serine protease [Mycolicibacterium sp. CBMA 329]MUL89673.1 serine protease [Mycolicibacterium sp. CBMA 331]MUL99848.1 serine protease [Mycolicibacterium sp. CBMA 334]MUM30257.1 serine protease [Mycolicibacterium sp. CBMA 295]MUM39188.1 serine protease [Mycolicibacterium sp. CBMA 247]